MSIASYSGYDFHSRQPCIRHMCVVSVASLDDTDTIDGWLKNHFAIAETTLRELPGIPEDDRLTGLARAVLWRALILYRDLLLGGHVPSFDQGKVLQVAGLANQPGVYQAVIMLPVIDNLPRSTFAGLFEQCLKVVQTELTQPPTDEAVKALHSRLDDQGIAKIKSMFALWGHSSPVYQIAFQSGVPFRHLGSGIMQLGWGANGKLFRFSSSIGDSAIGQRIAGNKWQAARLLRDAGLPGVENLPVYSHEGALRAAHAFGWPVVVKPADGRRSEGVTVDICDDESLVAAYDMARAISEHVLVERFVPGLCYRILVAEGRVIYAVSRLPKSVVGNGNDTVAALVDQANKARMKHPPWKRLKSFPLDEEAAHALAAQNMCAETVPEEGKRVFLRSITSGDWGGSTENMTARIHPANVKLATDVTRLLGISIAGIDLMTTDLTKPWYETGAAINEINNSPEFMVHNREEDAKALIAALMTGDGRIPVHLVTGEGNLPARAAKLKQKLAQEGCRCHLTTATHTEDADGVAIPMVFDTLFERTLALVLRNDVESIVMAGSLPEVFDHGVPVDRLERVQVFGYGRDRGEQIIRGIKSRISVEGTVRTNGI